MINTENLLNAAPTLLSAIATSIAAYAAWRGPAKAVIIAEKLRRQSETKNEILRTKREVFFTLMRERATTYTKDAVGAFNTIDIAFNDAENVRELWAEYFLSLEPSRNTPLSDRNTKLRNLLREMAVNIGLSDKLKIADLERVYYPSAIAEREQIETHHRQQALKEIIQDSTTPSKTSSTFPPKPTIFASPVGRLASVWGRKNLLLIGFAVLPIRGFLYTLTHDPIVLVSIQLLDGIGAVMFGVISVLVIADLTKGTGRFNLAQGAIATAVGIGASLSQVFAGSIAHHLGFNAAFLCLSVIAACAFLLFLIFMPETLEGKPGTDRA